MSQEAMKLALNKAFQLGQRYWSWADSEYSSHWKKADAAKAEFDQLMQDTINAALAEQPAQRCPLCNYQHGHAIGCKNNPVDIALNKMAENDLKLGLDYTITQTGVGIGKPVSDHRLMKGQADWEAVAADRAMTIGLLKAVQADQPAKQEPVATKLESQRFNGFPVSSADFEKLKALPVGTKLYTTPQVQSAQRTVGDAQEWDDRHGTGGSYGIGGCYGPAAFTDGGLDGY